MGMGIMETTTDFRLGENIAPMGWAKASSIHNNMTWYSMI
jgi:hypothetical protein